MPHLTTPDPEWFSTWFDSPYYHLLYHDRDYTEAGAFIETLLQHLHPKPDAHLLDLACGQGRHALQLSTRGYEVTGLDLSAENIVAAQRQEQARLHFYVHDMRDPLPYGPFDLVFNLFTSFGYFQDESENVLALRNATAALRPGGKMVIDFLNTERAVRELVAHEYKTVAGITFHLHRHLDRDFIVKEINFQVPGGQEHHYVERVRALSIQRFEEYFYLAGLRVAEMLGDYHLHPYDEESSPRTIFILKK
ncbi:class I SAM-dependent methyltransferase [uncultured Hymenobacter sp.]|uniref:class I SAM-dependent methyltransferase n=1 Tax=uncultured Hymenobacter sp. TaxID=170016 RepID=UPI0035C95B33